MLGPPHELLSRSIRSCVTEISAVKPLLDRQRIKDQSTLLRADCPRAVLYLSQLNMQLLVRNCVVYSLRKVHTLYQVICVGAAQRSMVVYYIN